MPDVAQLVAVVPAAGLSTRMGVPKPLLAPGGRSFVSRVVEALRAGGCQTVFVGVRAGDAAVAAEARRCGAIVVTPADVERGPIASVQAALSALDWPSTPNGPRNAPQKPADSLLPVGPWAGTLLLHPVDHPLVRPSTVRTLVEGARGAGLGIQVVLPGHGERRGHPTLFRGAALGELRDPALEGGARTVVRREPERVLRIEVEDPGVVTNLDTPVQLQAAFGEVPS